MAVATMLHILRLARSAKNRYFLQRTV